MAMDSILNNFQIKYPDMCHGMTIVMHSSRLIVKIFWRRSSHLEQVANNIFRVHIKIIIVASITNYYEVCYTNK